MTESAMHGERGFRLEVEPQRWLAYCIAGPNVGFPLFLFHGWGESRLMRHPQDNLLYQFGIKLITVDRPGVGLSSPKRGRRVVDWAEDVAFLADHLGCREFAVLGRSAGAAYAAACAYSLPKRVISVSLV